VWQAGGIDGDDVEPFDDVGNVFERAPRLILWELPNKNLNLITKNGVIHKNSLK